MGRKKQKKRNKKKRVLLFLEQKYMQSRITPNSGNKWVQILQLPNGTERITPRPSGIAPNLGSLRGD